jgi:superfamily I DNA/RNA helicase
MNKTKSIAPHLVIEARAGTGKTTTLIEGLKYVMGGESSMVPSSQQSAIWHAMMPDFQAGEKPPGTVCFCAFNSSIAAELKARVPEGCEAMTMHSMGYRAVRRAFPSIGRVNKDRVQAIIAEILRCDVKTLRYQRRGFVEAVKDLVDLCKMNLYNPDAPVLLCPGQDPLADLASYYDIDLNGNSSEVFDLVPRVLERCKDVERDRCCDFSDMIWLPVVLGLNIFKYDLLLIDEFQDCNRCQHSLAKMCGDRLILCGDPRQSIYGFAGADSQSMSRMEEELRATDRGCLHLPLTVTRRCGKAIVEEAKKIVPDFEAFETNPEGKILRLSMKTSRERGSQCEHVYGADNVCQRCGETAGYRSAVADGDMILCRCNAPLVSECFKFLRAGRRADIQGRKIGQGLISTVTRLCNPRDPADVPVELLLMWLDDWLLSEQKKERAKRHPSDQKLISLQDRHACLACFADEVKTAAGVIGKIESVFTDESRGGIKLSSVHKAKGLEARRVFILLPKEAPMPHPLARSPWEKEQELNLKYVAITRAIEELVWVS